MDLKSSKTRLNKMRKDLTKFIKQEIKEQNLTIGKVSVTEDNSTEESNTYIGCNKNFGLRFYKLINLDNSYSPLDIYKMALIFVNLLKADLLEDAFYLSTAHAFRATKDKNTDDTFRACAMINDLRDIRNEQSRMSINN